MARKITSVKELNALREQAQAQMALRTGTQAIQVTVHMGTCGIAAGAREILAQFLANPDLAGVLTLRQSGCLGLCEREPMLTLRDASGAEFVYGKLDKARVREIIKEHVLGGRPVARYLVKA